MHGLGHDLLDVRRPELGHLHRPSDRNDVRLEQLLLPLRGSRPYTVEMWGSQWSRR
jgi:hypothetical protein